MSDFSLGRFTAQIRLQLCPPGQVRALSNKYLEERFTVEDTQAIPGQSELLLEARVVVGPCKVSHTPLIVLKD